MPAGLAPCLRPACLPVTSVHLCVCLREVKAPHIGFFLQPLCLCYTLPRQGSHCESLQDVPKRLTYCLLKNASVRSIWDIMGRVE